MKAIKQRPKESYASPRTMTLLEELGEECQRIIKLLSQLEMPGLAEEQVEALLGELSAAILHLHEHTRGLDKNLDQDLGESRTFQRSK